MIDVHAIMLHSGDRVEINGDASHKEIKHTTYGVAKTRVRVTLRVKVRVRVRVSLRVG